MTLKQLPKVCDKVRFIGGDYGSDVTFGKIYEIIKVYDEDCAVFIDNSGYRSIIWSNHFRNFELVKDDDSPTITNILSNLALRTSLLEKSRELLAELIGNEVGGSMNGKSLRIYTGTDVEGDIKTEVTVGINEATGVMYVLGMKTEVVE